MHRHVTRRPLESWLMSGRLLLRLSLENRIRRSLSRHQLSHQPSRAFICLITSSGLSRLPAAMAYSMPTTPAEVGRQAPAGPVILRRRGREQRSPAPVRRSNRIAGLEATTNTSALHAAPDEDAEEWVDLGTTTIVAGLDAMRDVVLVDDRSSEFAISSQGRDISSVSQKSQSDFSEVSFGFTICLEAFESAPTTENPLSPQQQLLPPVQEHGPDCTCLAQFFFPPAQAEHARLSLDLTGAGWCEFLTGHACPQCAFRLPPTAAGA